MLSITRSWHPSFKLDRENGWGGKSNYHLWMSLKRIIMSVIMGSRFWSYDYVCFLWGASS